MAGLHTRPLGVIMSIISIVNGSIGGAIVVIPVVALKGGWLLSILACLIPGAFSYFSCYVSYAHMGDQNDLEGALMRHYNGSKGVKLFYSVCIWLSLLTYLVILFDLSITQCQGLIFSQTFTIWNPLMNGAIFIVWCLLLKFFDFGVQIMGYGIFSIIGYLVFVAWVLFSSPSGDESLPAFKGSEAFKYFALMQSVNTLQGMIFPITMQHQNRPNHNLIIFMSFIFTGLLYVYISQAGSLGILHRQKKDVKGSTIEAYFSGEWEVKLLKAIYLLHIYSVYPQVLLLFKERFFGVFGLPQSGFKQLNFKQVVYMLCTIAFTLFIGALQISLQTIIAINGSIVSFCLIFVFPLMIHIRCVYFSQGKRQVPVEQLTSIQTSQDGQSERSIGQQLNPTKGKEDYSFYYCSYDKSRLVRNIETGILIFMTLFGIGIMVYTISEVF